MPLTDFNPSQLKALESPSHVGITAAAGSGKTTVLVERFVRILERNQYRPEQIVAITFTEEAAAQMRDRIRSAVRARAGGRIAPDPAGSDRPVGSWEGVETLLPLAKITTIHGFCYSLLREYPFEVGLDPDFQLLSPGRQELLLLKTVRRLLEDLSRSNDSTLAALLDFLPLSKLEPMLQEMIRRRNYLGLAGPAPPSLERLERIYRRETATVLRSQESVSRLERLLTKIPDDLLQEASSWSRRCRAQIDLFDRRDLSAEDFVSGLAATLSGRVSPSRSWRRSPLYPAIREVWSRLKQVLARFPLQFEPVSAAEDSQFRHALASLVALYGRALDRFREIKKERSVLDFEDLLDLARKLVGKPRVKEALRRRYRHFLVDEFQDTNDLQWEIIEPLIGPKGSLFAVGDAKQSIYRFRDADVSVFKKVQAWIKGRGELVDMPQNYRSLPELVEFSNRIFSRLLQNSLGYEAGHQQMEPCRSASADEIGHVETYFYGDGDDDTPCEPELIAAWVSRMIQRQNRKPQDIALLLRTRTRLKEFEEALQQYGIPHYAVGGIGFYQRQEVLDLINLLRFLVHPENNVALVGVLRSPLFSFSDEELFLTSLENGCSFWEKLQNLSRNGTPRLSPADFALGRLREWLGSYEQDAIAGLLRRIFRETGYLAVLDASKRAAQNLANVQKFLALATDFERNGRCTVREFLRYVDALMDGEVPEAESTEGEDMARGVRIYTIHGAKGLQFPVVFLPQLGTPFSWGPTDRFLYQSVRAGMTLATYLGFKIWNPLENYDELVHPVYRMLKKLDEYRQLAEEKRLLYVATTRAQDHLILVGRRSRSPSFARWLLDSGADSFQISKDFLSQLMNEKREGTYWPPIAEKPEPTANRQKKKSACGIRLVDARTPACAFQKAVWTPTEISLFEVCPRRSYLSRIQGYSEQHPLNPQPLSERSMLLGSAVHEILERVPDLRDQFSLESQIRWWADQLDILVPQSKSTEKELRYHLNQVLRSPFYQRVIQAPRVFSEKPFQVRYGNLRLRGVIDKLFQEQDGRWKVIDFKTNSVRPEELAVQAQQSGHLTQLEVYLWAVSRILKTSLVEGVLFFTQTGDLLATPFTPEINAKCETLMERLPRTTDRTAFPKTRDVSRCLSCGFLERGLCSGGPPRQRSLWEAAPAVEAVGAT